MWTCGDMIMFVEGFMDNTGSTYQLVVLFNDDLYTCEGLVGIQWK